MLAKLGLKRSWVSKEVSIRIKFLEREHLAGLGAGLGVIKEVHVWQIGQQPSNLSQPVFAIANSVLSSRPDSGDILDPQACLQSLQTISKTNFSLTR